VETKAYKHLYTLEIYIARSEEKPYITWNYFMRKWTRGLSSVWSRRKDYTREISWLEVLIATGASKEDAINLWHEYTERGR